MEAQIQNYLTNAECDYIEITDLNSPQNPMIRYYCECACETTKSWILIQNNTKCQKCMGENTIGENDVNIIKRGLEKGLFITNVNRGISINKNNTKISFTCKCKSIETAMLSEFDKEDFAGCKKCTEEKNKREWEHYAIDKGFTNAEPHRHKSDGGKSRITISFTCKCGNKVESVKFETYKKPSYVGCNECTKIVTSQRIRKSIGSKTKEDIISSLADDGYTDAQIVKGECVQKYVVNYKCTCGNIVEKLWRSVLANPKCIPCIKKVKKDLKREEIKAFMLNRGHICEDVYRTDDQRIMVKFKCKCGNVKTSQWDVINRDKFTGCDECYDSVRIQNIITSAHTESANAKRRNTCLEIWGTECNLQSPEIKEKIKETNIKLYGVANVSQSEIIKERKKETLLSNHGVDSPMRSEFVRETFKTTMMERHGEDNPSKVNDIHVKQQKFSKYTSPGGKDYYYQGYEHFAIKKLVEEHNIADDNVSTCHELILSKELPRFVYYTDDGTEHTYRPDIRLKNNDGTYTFIEVKSNGDVFCENLSQKLKSVTDAGYRIMLWRFNQSGKLVMNKTYGD